MATHGEATWRELLSNVFKRSLPFSIHTKLQPSGVPKKEQHSVLGYIISPDGAEKLCDNETPRYNLGDETFEWRNHTDTDSTMEIFVTCTHAGIITQPHDGPGLDSYIWHISGIKLWIVWDSSPSNMHKVAHNNCNSSDLEWCLDNLDGTKVSVWTLQISVFTFSRFISWAFDPV
jgi:hypothetical protein